MREKDWINREMGGLLKRYPALSEAGESILAAFFEMESCYRREKKLLIAGNGGSSSDAQHMVGELMKGFASERALSEEKRQALRNVDERYGEILAEKLQGALPAIALCGHTALNSAFSNDVEPVLCYAQQVNGYGTEGDVLLAISTSGNSENIIYAAVAAKAMGMKVIAFTGETGGRLASYADVAVKIPGTESYKIQELQLPVYHWWCLMLEQSFWR